MRVATNSHCASQTNGLHKETAVPKPLNITIVGAGIGGLTAAIGLRRNGHNVSIYEQSRFASETGAAIQLCPNANGLLRRFGIDPEEFGSVTMRKLSEFTAQGVEKMHIDLTESSKMWQHPWQLSHRVRLHDRLKQEATSKTGIGKPAELYVSSRVLEADPESSTIVLEDGEKIQSDLILGADGIHSRTRVAVAKHPGKLFSSGKSAFRFLIPRDVAVAVAQDMAIFQGLDHLGLWYADDRRVVVYPCDDNKLLNFVCIHPEHESQGSAEEWNTQATIEQVLTVYEGFDPRLLAVIKKADPDSIKAWKLVDMEVLPTWVNGRLGLLGDAAHPFLPHQGQGGGVAMEDAVALAVVFQSGTAPDEVPERLKLYEKIRYERANAIQEYSRQAGMNHINGKPQVDMMKYVPYNFGHDEWDNSSKVFEAWQRAKTPNLYQGLPIGFGPLPNLKELTTKAVITQAVIKFRTSRTFLQRLLPTESFSFQSPGSVAYASFRVTTNTKFLGGVSRATFGLFIHGVQYNKRDGTVVNGTYLPLNFEHQADPSLPGIENWELFKVQCELDIQREAGSYQARASWHGAKFASFEISGLQPETVKQSRDEEDNLLVYNYAPAVIGPEKGYSSYSLIIPVTDQAHVTSMLPKLIDISTPPKATVSFYPSVAESSPRLHCIISRFSEIPIYEVVEATLSTDTLESNLSSAWRIE